MTVQRMDNVGIVVDDLPAAIAFFRELGLELEGQAVVDRDESRDGFRSVSATDQGTRGEQP